MRYPWLLCLLIMALPACSMKTSEQISLDLWKTWEAMDELVQEDYPGRPPVILIHGWNGGEFTWPAPAELRKLEERLQRDIYLFTYRTGIAPNRYPPLEILEEKLDRFLSQYAEVDVVAHSMGGLLLRQYLSHHPVNPVRRIVFLSTPHFGTDAAHILAGFASISAEGNIQASELRPGSEFLWQLNSLEGAELEGKQVLNVYAGDDSLLETDLVVDASSAYLPWAHNAQVRGDHHTLAKSLPGFGFIVDFLQDGVLPAPAPVPKRRDVWLRFVHADGAPVRLTESSLKRLDAKGINRQAGVSICCEERSGLYPLGGNVAVIEDLQPGERIEYISRKTAEKIALKADDLRRSRFPVQLKTVMLGHDGGSSGAGG